MDWFQWLSQTTLHPSLVYNYGVLFACNDLTLNDIAYFDHAFLLSMGVKIGKHRLEILKLARAQPHHKIHSFKSMVATARRGLVRYAKKWSSGGGGSREEAEGLSFRRISSPLQVEWKEIREEEVTEMAIVRSGNVGFDGTRFLRSPGLIAADTGEKTAAISGPIGIGKVLGPRRNMSGPINGGRPVKAQIARFSGPLDDRLSPRYAGPLDERFGYIKSPRYFEPLDVGMDKSPRLSCQLDECRSPWAMLFDDLKPT